MKEFLISSIEQAREMYVEYRKVQHEYCRRPGIPFSSPLKESTFIKRLQRDKKVKVGETVFIQEQPFN